MKNEVKKQMRGLLIVLAGVASYAQADEYDDWAAKYPLHDAVGMIMEDEEEEVLQMIRSAETVNVPDDNGCSPLHYCRFNVDVAKALLKKGVDVNMRDKWGRTALHSVSKKTVGELMELYIKAGVHVGYRDRYGETAKQVAMKTYGADDKKGRAEMESLFSLAGKDSAYTVLHAASERGNVKEVKRLLDAGADVNVKDMYGETPLHKAADAGYSAVADLLIKHGADIMAQDMDGRTPLHLAAANSPETARLLLKKGAKVRAKDKFGMTPLHLAAGNDNVENVRMLVRAGAEVNDKKQCGITPLQAAAGHSGYTVLPVLLKLGADMTILSDDGYYAYEMIPGRGDEMFELRKLLGEKE